MLDCCILRNESRRVTKKIHYIVVGLIDGKIQTLSSGDTSAYMQKHGAFCYIAIGFFFKPNPEHSHSHEVYYRHISNE